MWRTAIVIAVLLAFVLFMAMNMHSVQVNVPFGKGFEVRIVFLVILSFVLGYAAAILIRMAKGFQNSKKESK